MKKILCSIFTLVLCLTFVGCTTEETLKSETDSPLKEVNIIYDKYGNVLQKTVYNELLNEYTLTKFTYKHNNSIWECVDQSVITYGGQATSGINPNLVIYSKQDLANKPIVIIDNSDIKISITKYLISDSWWEFGYEIAIENKTAKVLSVVIDNASIMSIQCDPLFSVEHIDAETTAYFILGWDKETMQRCHIPYIDNVEFMVRVFDNESWSSPALYGARLMIKN